MDALQALIAAQKQKVADEKKNGGAGWIRRGKVVERLRAEAEQRALDEERKRRREETERLKRLAEHLDQKNKRACGTSTQDDDAHTHTAEDAAQDFEGREEVQPPLAKSDVVKKLRRLKEPVTLFGETDWQRYTRLCHLELLHHEDELMGGQRNAFLNPHDDDEEEELDDDDAHPRGNAGDGAPSYRRRSALSSSQSGTASHTPRTAYDNAAPPEGGAENDASRKTDGGDKDTGKSDGAITTASESAVGKDNTHEQKACSKETTSEEAKNSAEGRFMTSLHRQTRKDVKPLLKKLKRKELEEDIREKLYDMVLCCEERKYRSAHDT